MIDFDKYFNKEIYGKLVTCNAIKKNSFYTVTVHVNNYCNFNCNYCAYSCINTQNTFDFNLPKIEEYLILLDNHIDVAKPFRISLTGGEVSLYPNLIDLVRYIYIYIQHEKEIVICTNGTGNQSLYLELMQYNVYFHISWHPQFCSFDNIMKLHSFFIEHNYTNYEIHVMLIPLPNIYQNSIFRFLDIKSPNLTYIFLQNTNPFSEEYISYQQYYNNDKEPEYRLTFEKNTITIQNNEMLELLNNNHNIFKGMFCDMYSAKISILPTTYYVCCFNSYSLSPRGFAQYFIDFNKYKAGRKCIANKCQYDCRIQVYKHLYKEV